MHISLNISNFYKMKNRNQYLLKKYYDIDNDIKRNFEQLSRNQFPKGTIEYADNTLFLMRCELLQGVYQFISEHFNEILDIYKEHADLTGQFFVLTTYGISCRDNENITEATRILNKAYHISYQLDDYDLIVYGLINFICLDQSLNNLKNLLEIFNDVADYLPYVTNDKIIGAYHLNYGYMLFTNGYIEKAIEHYQLALEAYSKFYTNKQASNILAISSNLAELYLEEQDYQKAIDIYTETYEIANKVNDNSIAYDCLTGLIKTYQHFDDYKNAFKYLQLQNNIISSFKNYSRKSNSEKLFEYLSTELDESKDNVILANLELKKKTLELDKNIKQLHLIAEVGKKITLAKNINDLFDLMINTMYGHLDYDTMGLFIVDAKNSVIHGNHIAHKNQIAPYSNKISYDDKSQFSTYCIRENKDIFTSDLRNEYKNYIDIDPSKVTEEDEGCRIYCRLLEDKEIIGIFTIQIDKKGVYDEQLFQTMKSISAYVAIALSNINKTRLLEEKTKRLEELSYYDALTGLKNRRAFIEDNALVQDNPDNYQNIFLILADMNHLKLINDNFGHLEGDRYLAEIAKVLQAIAEGYNYHIYRISGDEFGVVILNGTEEEVIDYIAKVKQTCHDKNYQPYPLSLAIGYAHCHTLHENKLFSEAEKQMYLDKERYYDGSDFERRERHSI